MNDDIGQEDMSMNYEDASAEAEANSKPAMHRTESKPFRGKIEKYAVGDYLRKDDLKVPKRFVITDFRKGINNFGKPSDFLHLSDKQKSYILIMGKPDINALVDLMGDDVNQWIGKSIQISGEEKVYQISGEMKNGIRLSFRL